MPASYPGAAKTFVSRNAGDVIQPAHINDLQDEVNAIETALVAGPTFPTVTLSSGQIVFPAVQNASAGANTLDDYEEGTWTPTLGGNTTYVAQTGVYTKIGRIVHVTGLIQVNVLGTGSTGTATGLPFSAAQISGGCIGFWGSLALTPVFVGCYASATSVVFTGITAAAASLSNPLAIFGNGATVYFSITYSI